MSRIRVGIIGASGITGGELIRLLLAHPDAEITFLGDRRASVRQSRSYIQGCVRLAFHRSKKLTTQRSGVDATWSSWPHLQLYRLTWRPSLQEPSV